MTTVSLGGRFVEGLTLSRMIRRLMPVVRNRPVFMMLCSALVIGFAVAPLARPGKTAVAEVPPSLHVQAGKCCGGGASFGVTGALQSLPMFYTDTGNGPSPPTYANLQPLVGYFSHANVSLGGWMYDGILFFAYSLAVQQTQSTCDAWTNNLFASGGWLDTLNAVVTNIGSQLGDTHHFVNVFLTTCFVQGQPNGNMVQNDYRMISDWNNKSYAHLSLAGFYWMFEDPSSSGCNAQYINTWLHGQNLGLASVWIPYFVAWEDLNGYCNGTNWESWGFDYVTAQPNYAFRCDLRGSSPTDPTNAFGVISRDLKSYPLAGVHFEIAYTRDDNNVTGGCSRAPTIEQNANAYLDAAFHYNWMSNRLNTFYYAPFYLSYYSTGGGATPTRCLTVYYDNCQPTPIDRAIHDRVWEFIHGYTTSGTNPSADAWVNSYYPRNNYGSDTHLFLGTNSINVMRTWTKWNLQGVVPQASYVVKATMSLYAQAWAYGSSITDGQLYFVSNNAWTEAGITWKNQPSSGSWSLRQSGITFSTTGIFYNFDVTSDVKNAVNSGSWNVTFMLKRATENFVEQELYFDSKENANVSLRPVLTVQFVKPTTVRQVVTYDAWVNIYSPNQNTGGDTRLILGTNSINLIRPYMMIGLAAYDSASDIYQGQLVLHLLAFYYGTSISDGQLYYVNNSNWTENGITWNSQPSSSTWQLRQSAILFSSKTVNYTFGINSDLVSQWSSGFASFMIKRASEDYTLHECGFGSNDYTTNLWMQAEVYILLKPY